MEVTPVYLLLSAPGGAPFNTAAAFLCFFTETTAQHYSLYIKHQDFHFWWVTTLLFITLFFPGRLILFVVKKIKLFDSFQTKFEIIDKIWRKNYIAYIHLAQSLSFKDLISQSVHQYSQPYTNHQSKVLSYPNNGNFNRSCYFSYLIV